MLVMRTTKDPTDPVGELISSQKTVWLDDLALAVDPLGLYGVKPRTLLGQQAAHDPHSFAAVFDAAVVLSEPSSHLAAYVPAGALSQMRSRTFLPAASSFSQHHKRNCVVMELTGRPSTNLSHVSSSWGR
jgi:hypothetical protein